jgi:hypothetical protein
MKVIHQQVEKATAQARLPAYDLLDKKDQLPRTIDKDGSPVTAGSAWWTSGLFPGTLWYLYEMTGDEELLNHAREYTSRVEKEQYTTDNHGVGFILKHSVGDLPRNSEVDVPLTYAGYYYMEALKRYRDLLNR